MERDIDNIIDRVNVFSESILDNYNISQIDKINIDYFLDFLKNDLKYLKKYNTIKNTPYEVPKGYKYCSDCKALTPHEEDKHRHSSCVICGSAIYSYNNCPNCGWEDPDNEESLEQEITLHNPGCHCDPLTFSDVEDMCESSNDRIVLREFLTDRYGRYKDDHHKIVDNYHKVVDYLKSINLYDCSCPRVTIYPITNVYNYECHPVFSMDCCNALEWSYDVRCPICGEVFDVSDSNC